MQRYNIFYQVHKGLRAMLYETALKLQHIDFSNTDEGEDPLEILEDVVSLFEKHAHSEDTMVFPAVEKYEPSVADSFEQEHVRDHQLAGYLSEAINEYCRAESAAEKFAAGNKIHAAFSGFMLFNIEHMAKEENVLNPILWRYYSDEELLIITQKILANISPDMMARYSKWMMRGLNNTEISAWLRNVEKSAPEPVFQSLFATAEKELPNKRFRQVLESLTEGAMLA